MGRLRFDGILFFPVTPFDTDGEVDIDILAQHVETRMGWNPGGVFPACGTGEYHALSGAEADRVVAAAVVTVGGRVPVVAGTGGPIAHAVERARSAADAGADALLVLPPYLVSGPVEGTIRYIETIAAASELPVIAYHRGGSTFTPDAVRRLADNHRVIGLKDGVGDIGLAQQLVLAARESGRDDFLFFNGLLTAELTQGAYRGLGVPLYSSAAFAMAPEIATAYHRAYSDGDETVRLSILDRFYAPLVRLRDETPGFGVSLLKAGLRLEGLDVGSVRPPLIDPSARQLQALALILADGRRLAVELAP